MFEFWGCSFVSKKRTRFGSNFPPEWASNSSRSISRDYLITSKSSENYCPRKLFSGSNSSPKKSLQKNRSIFCLKNRSCDRRDDDRGPQVFKSVNFFSLPPLVSRSLTHISQLVSQIGPNWTKLEWREQHSDITHL